MKVLMVEPGGWGGISHYTYNLCQALCAQGARVTLVTARDYELRGMPRAFDLVDQLNPHGNYRSGVRALARVWRRLRPGITHLQATLSARRDWVWFPLLNLLDIPVAVTAHNILPHDRTEREAFGMTFAHSVIYRLADAVFLHGQANREELLRIFPVSERRVSVIPHGDYTFSGPTVAKADARRRLDLSPDDRVLLCFGTIRNYKGVHHLIPAFGKVLQKVPGAKLVIAGKPIGVDLEAYERAIDTAGVRRALRLEPRYVPMDEIPVYFGAADLVVLPYVSVYQSGALQLAYAHARPVVVTAVGALPETVRGGVNGLIVPPGDPDQLAGAIVDLLSLPDADLEEMGRQSRRMAEREFGWESIARRTMEVYRGICTHSGSQEAPPGPAGTPSETCV